MTESEKPPILLSGGNPQIPKGEGDAVVQSYIAAMPGWKHDVGRRLDDLITAALPDVRKAVKWNTPFYGAHDDVDEGWFLGFHCITKYVKVAWLLGTELDPVPPVAAKNGTTRYFHIFEDDTIDADLITTWVQQSAKLPGAKL